MSGHISHQKKTVKRRGDGVFCLSELDSSAYDFSPRNIISIAVGAAVLAVSLLLRTEGTVRIICLATASLIASAGSIGNIIRNFKAGRYFCEALMMMAAAVACFAVGDEISGALTVIFYGIFVHAKNYFSEKRKQKADEVLRILPGQSTVIENGEKVRVKAVHIDEGDIVLVEAGETVPVDGTVIDGTAVEDLSRLTRTSETMTSVEGMDVYSGSVNSSESFVMRALSDSKHSTAQRIYSAFSSCVSAPSRFETLAARICSFAVPVMTAAAVFFAVIVPLFKNNWMEGAKTAIILLICAMPLSINEAFSLAVYTAAEKVFSAGAVMRDNSILELFAKVQTFVCNKTGTVTESEYRVTDICPASIEEDDFLSVLCAAEKYSYHPIAAAIRGYCGTVRSEAPADSGVTEIPGKGVSVLTRDTAIYAGNANFLYEHSVVPAVPDKSGTAVHLAVNGIYCGYVLLENKLRSGSYDALEKMRSLGVKTFAMLSNDLRSIARPIAGSLNFNTVRSEMNPGEKASAVEYLKRNTQEGSLVFAFTGDDEEDAAEKADISVRLTSIGKPLDDSLSSVSVLGQGLSSLPEIIRAAKDSVFAVRADFVLNVAIRLVFIILAFSGVKPAGICAVAVTLAGLAGFFISGRK